MESRFQVERMEARILDIPTIRPHKLSFGSIGRQSPVIVQVWLVNGASAVLEIIYPPVCEAIASRASCILFKKSSPLAFHA